MTTEARVCPPLSLDRLRGNFIALSEYAEGGAREGLSGLKGSFNGQISRVGTIDLASFFLKTYPVEIALQRTHDSYHYWRQFTVDHSVVHLQDYFKRGCEGRSIDAIEILPFLEILTEFYRNTRFFFARVAESDWLKGLIDEKFCRDCLKNVFLFESYFQVFKLQASYNLPLPFFLLSRLVKESRGINALDFFLQELQTRNVPTRVLHRGIVGFLQIHSILFRNEPRSDASSFERALQDRRLELLAVQRIPLSTYTLFFQTDEVHSRWRCGLKPGSKVILKEKKDREWRKSEWILGEQVGRKSQGEDYLIHFEVQRGRESVNAIAPNTTRSGWEADQDNWRDIPHCAHYILTIAHNEAALGIKQSIQRSIRARQRTLKAPFIGLPFIQTAFTDEKNHPFSAANLTPLLPLRLDIDGRCALYPRLRPIPPEQIAPFARRWIEGLEQLSETPLPLSSRFVMLGDVEREGRKCVVAFYLKIAYNYPKNPEILSKLRAELVKN